ncbi:YgcG family protein [Rudaea sp.]|uniref:TPM domain-containing protein n=1 Tax=Rudaea sp. TaxID=2136325 RepID=UPI002ED513DB
MFSGKIGRVTTRTAAIGLLYALTLTSAIAQDGLQSVPLLAARITDTTDTLNAQQTQELESELAALEQRKGAQIAVLIVPTTQPEDIAPYATRVFEQWKLGRKGIDDGVLLIVAKDDHRVRIEVGRGLEGAIPDAAAARIIREYITPKFRDNDYYLGLHDAIAALTSLVDGESLPAPLDGSASSDAQNAWPWWFVILAIALIGGAVGTPVSVLLSGIFSIFPIRVVPIGARRAAGLLVGPLVVVGLYLWAKHAGVQLYNAAPGDVPVFTPVGLAGIATITAWMGWLVAPKGASQQWVGGMTWGELFSNLLGLVFSFLLDVLLGGGGGGISSSGGGFSGGGGSSGGGGASGSW